MCLDQHGLRDVSRRYIPLVFHELCHVAAVDLAEVSLAVLNCPQKDKFVVRAD